MRRSRRTVQVAQHDYRLAPTPDTRAESRFIPGAPAAVAVGPRLIRPPDLESEAVGARSELRTCIDRPFTPPAAPNSF